MTIIINGQNETLDDSTSLLELINKKGLDKYKIVIEKNMEIIPRDDFSRIILVDKDSLEIVSFVGGG